MSTEKSILKKNKYSPHKRKNPKNSPTIITLNKFKVSDKDLSAIQNYSALTGYDKAQFQVTLNFNKLLEVVTKIPPIKYLMGKIYKKPFPEGSRPRYNKIIENHYLGRILEKADDLPPNFGKDDMVIAVVQPGEMLEVNDPQYFKILEEKGINHIILPVKDHTANFSETAAARTLAEMHKTLNAGNKIYIHCKAGRSRSATLLTSLYMIVAKDFLLYQHENIQNEKKYNGYEDFINALKSFKQKNYTDSLDDNTLADFIVTFLKEKRPQVDIKDDKEKAEVMHLAQTITLEDINNFNFTEKEKIDFSHEQKYQAFQNLAYKQLNHYPDSKEKRYAIHSIKCTLSLEVIPESVSRFFPSFKFLVDKITNFFYADKKEDHPKKLNSPRRISAAISASAPARIITPPKSPRKKTFIIENPQTENTQEELKFKLEPKQPITNNTPRFMR